MFTFWLSVVGNFDFIQLNHVNISFAIINLTERIFFQMKYVFYFVNKIATLIKINVWQYNLNITVYR